MTVTINIVVVVVSSSRVVPVSVLVLVPDAMPGDWIWPAKAETASINVRITTAHCLRKVFTFLRCLLVSDAKILHPHYSRFESFLQEGTGEVMIYRVFR